MVEVYSEHAEAPNKLRALLKNPPEGLPAPEAKNLSDREVPLKRPEMREFRKGLEKIEGPVRDLIADHWEEYGWAEKQGLKAGWSLTNSYSSDALEFVKVTDSAWGTSLAVETLEKLSHRTEAYLGRAQFMVETGQSVPMLTDFGRDQLRNLGTLVGDARKALMPEIEALKAKAGGSA